jgi:hypothetical protein
MRPIELIQFTDAYFQALYFTETGDSEQPPADAELYPEEIERHKADCASFFYRFRAFIEAEPEAPGFEQAGHDFWLTRQGHGAGFWDGDWTTYGHILTDGAESYGETWPEFIE